jgi:hypothetical protein
VVVSAVSASRGSVMIAAPSRHALCPICLTEDRRVAAPGRCPDTACEASSTSTAISFGRLRQLCCWDRSWPCRLLVVLSVKHWTPRESCEETRFDGQDSLRFRLGWTRGGSPGIFGKSGG